jgi:hypothetical protein
MLDGLKPKQRLYLWDLANKYGTELNNKLKPSITLKERNELVRENLIEIVGKRPLKVNLTDVGWHYLQGSLTLDLISDNKSGGFVFQDFLKHLAAFLTYKKLAFVDIFTYSQRLPEEKNDFKKIDTKQEISDRIKNIGPTLAEPSGRIRLFSLREALSDIPRERLDEVILWMLKERLLSLYSLDDPHEIDQSDEKAAIRISDYNRHIIYLK